MERSLVVAQVEKAGEIDPCTSCAKFSNGMSNTGQAVGSVLYGGQLFSLAQKSLVPIILDLHPVAIVG